MGLIEVIVALTVLLLVLLGVGWLITSSLSATEESRQRSTAASIIEETDADIQSAVPPKTCTAGATYIPGVLTGAAIPDGINDPNTFYSVTATPTRGTGSLINTLSVQIQVSWRSALPAGSTGSLTNQLLVQCQP